MKKDSSSFPEMIDILVIGGGINGTGIARDAAGRGLSVSLCEKDDLASHTSSSSTKLIHGGLRYLEYFDFLLVRHALQEREILLSSARRVHQHCFRSISCPSRRDDH
jgi:glycerol-3-phosphate dehydrogenase